MIDAVTQNVRLTPAIVRRLPDRKTGIGCDQLLVVEPPTQPDIDFSYRIYNSNGDEVEQCGNGARCFARFVFDQGLTDKSEIAVETAKGVIYPRLENNGLVTVNMGAPRFAPSEIPFEAPNEAIIDPLIVDGQVYDISVVSS